MPKTTYAPFHNRIAWICRSPGVAEHSYTSAKATDDLAAYQEANDIKRKSLATVYAVRQTLREMEIGERLSSHRFPHGGLSDLMHKIKTRPNLINYWAKIYNARRA